MITGGVVKKVSAEKLKNAPHEGMDINIQIKDATFDKTKLTIAYKYDIEYKAEVAKMSLEGELYIEDSEKEVKTWKEQWDKNKQLPENVSSDFITALTYTCSAIGTLLAFSVNINAPINVPRARITPKEGQPAA